MFLNNIVLPSPDVVFSAKAAVFRSKRLRAVAWICSNSSGVSRLLAAGLWQYYTSSLILPPPLSFPHFSHTFTHSLYYKANPYSFSLIYICSSASPLLFPLIHQAPDLAAMHYFLNPLPTSSASTTSSWSNTPKHVDILRPHQPHAPILKVPTEILLEVASYLPTLSDRSHFSSTVSTTPSILILLPLRRSVPLVRLLLNPLSLSSHTNYTSKSSPLYTQPFR